MRLAQECPDLCAREALEELAAEFQEMAQFLAKRSLGPATNPNKGKPRYGAGCTSGLPFSTT
jgi:hypothetical protein